MEKKSFKRTKMLFFMIFASIIQIDGPNFNYLVLDPVNKRISRFRPLAIKVNFGWHLNHKDQAFSAVNISHMTQFPSSRMTVEIYYFYKYYTELLIHSGGSSYLFTYIPYIHHIYVFCSMAWYQQMYDRSAGKVSLFNNITLFAINFKCNKNEPIKHKLKR